jgi:hypothetical protein
MRTSRLRHRRQRRRRSAELYLSNLNRLQHVKRLQLQLRLSNLNRLQHIKRLRLWLRLRVNDFNRMAFIKSCRPRVRSINIELPVHRRWPTQRVNNALISSIGTRHR